jgi:hypothetical protein
MFVHKCQTKNLADSTAYQLHGQLLEDRSRENVPLVGLIKEKPEYVFKVISSHQSEYNDWALELYLNCIVYSNEGFPNLSFMRIKLPIIDLVCVFIFCSYLTI